MKLLSKYKRFKYKRKATKLLTKVEDYIDTIELIINYNKKNKNIRMTPDKLKILQDSLDGFRSLQERIKKSL